MLLREKEKARSPRSSAGRPGKDEIIALSLGCMHEYAEKLAVQAQQQRNDAAQRLPDGGCAESS